MEVSLDDATADAAVPVLLQLPGDAGVRGAAHGPPAPLAEPGAGLGGLPPAAAPPERGRLRTMTEPA